MHEDLFAQAEMLARVDDGPFNADPAIEPRLEGTLEGARIHHQRMFDRRAAVRLFSLSFAAMPPIPCKSYRNSADLPLAKTRITGRVTYVIPPRGVKSGLG